MRAWLRWIWPCFGIIAIGLNLNIALGMLVNYVEIDMLTTVLGRHEAQPIGQECAVVTVLIVTLILWVYLTFTFEGREAVK